MCLMRPKVESLSLTDGFIDWWLGSRKRVQKARRRAYDSFVFLVVWSLWRNRRVFRSSAVTAVTLVEAIFDQCVCCGVVRGLSIGRSCMVVHTITRVPCGNPRVVSALAPFPSSFNAKRAKHDIEKSWQKKKTERGERRLASSDIRWCSQKPNKMPIRPFMSNGLPTKENNKPLVVGVLLRP
jgi:hypothetical protein